jgi:GDPmannose 4,6-dehydratase
MWLMLQQESPEDFVIATGKTYAISDFVEMAFTTLGLDWTKHVRQADDIRRPTDLLVSRADPSKAKAKLGWQARTTLPEVVRKMIDSCGDRC